MNVNASLLGDRARLEFSMRGMDDDVTLRQNDTSIILNFKRTVYTDPEILKSLAPGYITDARLSQDLSSIIITAAKKYKLTHLRMNDTLFLELIGMPDTDIGQMKTAANQAKKPELPRLNAKEEPQVFSSSSPPAVQPRIYAVPLRLELDVESNRNQTIFGFNWNRKVPFSSQRLDDGVALTFSANAVIDDKDVISLLQNELKGFKSSRTDDSLTVFIPVPRGFKQRTVQNGNSTIAILTKTPEKKPNATTVPPQKKKPPVPPAQKTGGKSATAQPTQPIQPSSPAGTVPAAAAVTVATAETQQQQTIPEQKNGTVLSSTSPAPPQDSDSTIKIGDGGRPEENESPRTFSLSFPWSRDTAAALFKKQGYWWLVFDRKSEIDFSLLKRLGGDVVHEIVQTPHTAATIIRMIIDSRYNPTVRKEGLLWIMDIAARETNPAVGLEVEPHLKSEVGAKLFIPTGGIGTILTLSDPLYGDSFIVIPVYGLGWGIAHKRTYPNLILPKTIQGVMVEPLSSGISVRTSTSGIDISRPPQGLSLSSDTIVSFEEELEYTAEGLDKLFDLKAFTRADTSEFRTFLPNFLARTALATKDQKNLQRLNLAKFYLANGYTPEALAILRMIEAADFSMAHTPAHLAVKGMASVIFSRPDAAIDLLNRDVFDDSDLAKVWLAAAYAQKEDYSPAQFNVFKKYVSAIRDLPYDIRAKIAILAVRTAINQENDNIMNTFLEMLIPEKNNPYQQAAYDYYKGLYYELTASFKDAEEYLTKAQNSQAQLYHTLGARDLAKLNFKLDQISLDDLVRKLERLRYAWRGDDFEFNLMNELVDIYLANERYPEALRKMNEIVKAFPNHRKTPAIKAAAIKTFEDLYFNDKAERIDPVTAIALFNEFRNLIPDNEAGNEMVKKLADRLVSVDLLANAADLLEKQLKGGSVQNKQRSAIGTRLALIRLLSKEPEKALEALDISIFFPISGALDEQRTMIRAKALADTGKLGDAIRLLDTAKTNNTQRLKVELYWFAKDWQNVSESIKPLIKKPEIGKPIADDQAQLVLYWATALKLSRNETALLRLRENFITSMSATKYGGLFGIISTPAGETIDVKNMSREVEAAQQFASFLGDYTKSLKNGNLSDIVK